MRWLCADDLCSWKPKPGRRVACPLCCGWTDIPTSWAKGATQRAEAAQQNADRRAFKAAP